MKLHHYPETDSLYIELKGGPSAETREIADGLNAVSPEDGSIVGFDGASRKLDLTMLETDAVPFRAIRAA